MLFTSHAIVGAAVGVAAGNPYYGFLGGIASHHVLDAIPHFDQGTFRVKKEGYRVLVSYSLSLDLRVWDWLEGWLMSRGR